MILFIQEIDDFRRKHIDPKGSWLTFVRYSDGRTSERQTNKRKKKRQKNKRNKTLVSIIMFVNRHSLAAILVL